MEELEFDPVDSVGAGALGEPGKRTFFIQGRKENTQVSVVVEKQQVEVLVNQSIAFLDSLNNDFPQEEIASPEDFAAAGVREPALPMFRAQSMGLIFDPDTLKVTLELRELPFEDPDDEPIEIPPEARDDEHILRLTMTRTQLRALAVRGGESVGAGREPCPLCQNPMDPTGHVCPRLN